MTTIERCARAIYARFPNWEERFRPVEPGNYLSEKFVHTFSWEESPKRHEACFETARAVLQAMREPTSAMCTDGDKAKLVMAGVLNAGDVWRAMIDAALSEK